MPGTGPDWSLYLEQHTPWDEGLVWHLNDSSQHPQLPKQVEWKGTLMHRDPETRRLQVARLGHLSDIVLHFTLNWLPFNLQQAQDGDAEAGRRALQAHQPHARGKERPNVFARGSAPPAVMEPPIGKEYDRKLLSQFRF